MRAPWSLCALLLTCAPAPPASACWCFRTPVCANKGPLPASEVALVGRVLDVWPSREQVERESRLPLKRRQAIILERWQSVLSPEEKQRVLSANSINHYPSPGDLRRVRLEVTERLNGPSVEVVFTDASSCGVWFQTGQTYLVIASAVGPRFQAHACGGSLPVDSFFAREDLRTLRAWKAGLPILPRIYGEVTSKDRHPGIHARLSGEGEVRVQDVDAAGRFSFEGLPPASYVLEVRDERGRGSTTLNLSGNGCFETEVFFCEKWAVVARPIFVPARAGAFHPLEEPLPLPPILPPPGPF